jgi:uncharacterized membrane protein
MVFINVQLVDGKKATFNDLFSQTSVLIKGVLAALLYGVIVLLGIICFIIPGIWLAIRLQFYKYLVVDKKMGPIEALKGSWNMTKGNVWNLITTITSSRPSKMVEKEVFCCILLLFFL